MKDPKAWEANFGQTAQVAAPVADRQGYLRADDAADGHRPVRQQDTCSSRRTCRSPVRKRRGTNGRRRRGRSRRRHRCPTRWPSTAAAIASPAPAISQGAKLFDAKGNLVLDDGYKAMAKKFYDWNRDGTMPKEVWGGVGGSTYRDAFEEFANGRVVLYLSGSWQIGRMEKQIGKNFDWIVVPNPCGPGGVYGHARRRRVRGLEEDQESEGRRPVPRLPRGRCDLRRVHGEDRQHPGECRGREEGRRIQRFAARQGRARGVRRAGRHAFRRSRTRFRATSTTARCSIRPPLASDRRLPAR